MAVADNPELSRAFIDNRIAQEQRAYREGEQAGRISVKTIMRNKVIIGTVNGDKLLTIENKETRQMAASSSLTQRAVAKAFAPSRTSANPSPGARTRFFSLNREDVEATLADTDQIMEDVEITPYTIADRPYGFRLGNIEPGSVLIKMGLRNGMVITGVNVETVTGPDQAAMFFQTLKEGGDIAIKYKRRRRTMQLNLSIG